MPEKITGINFAFYFYQSSEIALEIHGAPNTSLGEASVLVVHSQIEVSVIDICRPGRCWNISTHVIIQPLNPIHVLSGGALASLVPGGHVLDFE
ncbi:hypothetical protein E1A91_A06G129000v1 [Gossypium mustelinum]|uniref:Uncharacterized protein n=2 Tax=Gossypium TaxID=3633 RepID=A0A5J5VD66_GOSBA|nr:hypothetical protein ES319_A06G129200v1 [Gossypium barbadense]TYJ30427.1 hypothetical protein E1A91_A06G129000v1 [Gossypium mustelinum]